MSVLLTGFSGLKVHSQADRQDPDISPAPFLQASPHTDRRPRTKVQSHKTGGTWRKRLFRPGGWGAEQQGESDHGPEAATPTPLPSEGVLFRAHCSHQDLKVSSVFYKVEDFQTGGSFKEETASGFSTERK